MCNSKGAELVLSSYTFHKDALSVNGTHSNITQTLLLSQLPSRWRGISLPFLCHRKAESTKSIFYFIFYLILKTVFIENKPQRKLNRTRRYEHRKAQCGVCRFKTSLCYYSHPSFQSIILLLECVLTNKQYPTHRCMAMLDKCGGFFPPYNKYQNSIQWLSFSIRKTQDSRIVLDSI